MNQLFVVISETRIYPIIGCRDSIKQKWQNEKKIEFVVSPNRREREWNDNIGLRDGNTHDSLNKEREREIEKERDAKRDTRKEKEKEREGERKKERITKREEYREYTLICVAVLSDHHASGTFTRKLGQLYGTRNRWCVCSCVLWLARHDLYSLTESTDTRGGIELQTVGETKKDSTPWEDYFRGRQKSFKPRVPRRSSFRFRSTRLVEINIYISFYKGRF